MSIKPDQVRFYLLGGSDGEDKVCDFIVKDCGDCPFKEMMAWKAFQSNCKLSSLLYKENLECSFKDLPDKCPLVKGERY